MTVTHTPLCTVRWCPAKGDPDWHACVVCGSTAIEHHHVENRGMGGSKRDIPVIALCHPHHEKITLNEWSSGVLPDGRIVIWGLHGDTIWETHGQGTEGLPGTLLDTSLPETAGPEELGENDGMQTRVGVEPLRRRAAGEEAALEEGPEGRSSSLPVRQLPDGSVGLVSAPAPDFGPDYLELPSEFTLQDAVPWAGMIGKWEGGRQWYAGDLLLACEARFGHERLWGQSVVDGKTFVDLLGMTYQSLRNCQRVCEAFSPGERFPLSFGHHAATYSLERPERDRLMAQATAEGWTVSQLREAATGHVEPETCICPTCGNEHRVKAQ